MRCILGVAMSIFLGIGESKGTTCMDTAAVDAASDDFVGYVSMTSDGLLHMHVYKSRTDHETFDYDLEPSNPDYELSREQADGIQPGERKPLRRILAIVRMDADRGITVHNFYREDDDFSAVAEPPPPTRLSPENEGYVEIIRLVGGLEPGHGKAILAGTEAGVGWRERYR